MHNNQLDELVASYEEHETNIFNFYGYVPETIDVITEEE